MSFFTEFCVLVYGNFYNVMSSGKIEVFLYGDFHSVVSNGKVVSFFTEFYVSGASGDWHCAYVLLYSPRILELEADS